MRKNKRISIAVIVTILLLGGGFVVVPDRVYAGGFFEQNVNIIVPAFDSARENAAAFLGVMREGVLSFVPPFEYISSTMQEDLPAVIDTAQAGASRTLSFGASLSSNTANVWDAIVSLFSRTDDADKTTDNSRPTTNNDDTPANENGQSSKRSQSS
ncbi:MAG: hypothetical protein AAB769_00870, partial [Patescibacteria group bacterium]